MLETPTRYADTACRLVRREWSPLPLRPDTKVPDIKWGGRKNSVPDLGRIAWEEKHFPDHACGIAIPPNVLVVDSDITDADLQRRVVGILRATLGKPAMVRVGRAPKVQAWYGAGPGCRSTKAHPIEVFCGSGQCVAFGVHPNTGLPYRWYGASPLDLAPSALTPIVSEAQLAAFLKAVAPITSPMRPMSSAPLGITGRGMARPSGSRLQGLLHLHGGRIRTAVRGGSGNSDSPITGFLA